MPILNQAPDDRTGITQPLDELIRAVRALSPERQPAARTKTAAALSAISTATHQEAATVIVTPDAPPPSPELTREAFLDLVSAQYDSGRSAWESTFQLPAEYLEALATKDTVIKWAKTIPQETIRAILRYGSPRLKLLTEMPVSNLLEVLNQHPTIQRQSDSIIWWNQWKTIAAEPGTFGLTPDIEDMPQESIYQNRKNPAIIAEYQRRFQQTPFSTSMPQSAYLPSAMDELARGKIYDRKHWTGFKQPRGAAHVPDAGWNGIHVRLGGRDPDDSNDRLRGRLWVPGGKA